MYRNASFMLPRKIIDILSLEEGKTRPAITMEFSLNHDGDFNNDFKLFKSYLKNVKSFNQKSFSSQILNYGTPFHDELHLYTQLAQILHKKRALKLDKTIVIPLIELIIHELVLIINSEIAKIALENDIPLAFAHRLNGTFRYSSEANLLKPYTRVTCPGRRSLDMVIIGQLTEFFKSDGKRLLFSESFFKDLSRYHNTRSPYLEEHGEEQLSHIDKIRSARRSKRFQNSPEQLSDQDIQYFFHQSPKDINTKIKKEVEKRIDKGPISNSTLVYIFFSGILFDNEIMKIIYTKIKNDTSYAYFFNILKKIDFINFQDSKISEEGRVLHTISLEIYGKAIIKDFYIPTVKNKKYEQKIQRAQQRTFRKDIREFIMQEYLTQLYNNA